MANTIASKSRGYTPTGAIASALAALSAADTALSTSIAGKANLTGGNTFSGTQTFVDGSDNTKASINATTGVGQFTGGLGAFAAANDSNYVGYFDGRRNMRMSGF